MSILLLKFCVKSYQLKGRSVRRRRWTRFIRLRIDAAATYDPYESVDDPLLVSYAFITDNDLRTQLVNSDKGKDSSTASSGTGKVLILPKMNVYALLFLY